MSDATHVTDRPIADLFRELLQEAAGLIRLEMELARTEFSERARETARDATWIAIAGVLGLAALGVITAAIVLGLVALGVPPWLAATLVGVTFGLIAGVILLSRISAIRRRGLMPTEAVESVKETARYLKAHATH